MASSTMVLPAGFLACLLAGGPVGSSENPRLDAYGDPLPPGATARFGSLRWCLPGAIAAVAISPNGKQVAAVNMAGKVAVWEKESGRLLQEFSGSKTGEGCIAFSPDSQYLATGGRFDHRTGTGDFRVRIWELKTGKLKAQLPSQNGAISKLVFAPDGATLLSAGFNQPVIAWKFPSGDKLREFLPVESGFHDVAVSPNGRWLALSGADRKTVTVCSFDSARKLFEFQTSWNFFHSFDFSADGKSLLTHEHDRVRLWEVATGKPRVTIALEHDSFREAQLSPGGRKIALTGRGHEIRWLDAATGKPLASWKGGIDRVDTLAFSRDGATVVSADWGAIRLWDASTGKVIQQPSGPSQICYSLIFSADGTVLLAASHNEFSFLDGRTLRPRTRVPVTVPRHSYPDYRYSVALSPAGDRAAFLGEKEEIVLVGARNPKVVRTLRRPGWLAASLAFSTDGKQLYAVGHKCSGLRVWNVQTGQEGSSLDEQLRPLSNLSVARAAGKIAVVVEGLPAHCQIWDLRTGKAERSLKCVARSILLSPDGKLLAAHHGNSVAVWDVIKQVERHRFDFGVDGPSDWAFSSDGSMLVTGHAGSFKTWNMADGKMVAEVRGHPGGMVALACSPDGTGLVSACTSCTVLRWQKVAWRGK